MCREPSLVIVSDDPSAQPVIIPVSSSDGSAMFTAILKHSFPMFPELTSKLNTTLLNHCAQSIGSNWRHLTNNTSTCIAIITPDTDSTYHLNRLVVCLTVFKFQSVDEGCCFQTQRELPICLDGLSQIQIGEMTMACWDRADPPSFSLAHFI